MLNSSLHQCARALSELTYANFPVPCVVNGALNQLSISDIRGDSFLERAANVSRFFLSVQRLIDLLLRKTLNEAGICWEPDPASSLSEKVYRPFYDDITSLEGADSESAFEDIVQERFVFMEKVLSQYGVKVSQESLDTLLREGWSPDNTEKYDPLFDSWSSIVTEFFDEDGVFREDPDELFTVYRINLSGILSADVRIRLAYELADDLDSGPFGVVLLSTKDLQEFLIIAPLVYSSNDYYGTGVENEEEGQALTAASFVYILAAILEERNNT